MSDIKWEEGKTYQFRKDMIDKFTLRYSSNLEITELIGNNTFTVKRVDSGGKVIDLVEFRRDDLDIEYWFDVDEMDYFDMVVDLRDTIKANNIRPDADIVVEWLEKLTYVLQVDQSVTDNLIVTPAGIVLEADYGSIYGVTSIHNFITNRYDLLQQEAKYKKNNELMERKAKLEAELAEVDKELGNV